MRANVNCEPSPIMIDCAAKLMRVPTLADNILLEPYGVAFGQYQVQAYDASCNFPKSNGWIVRYRIDGAAWVVKPASGAFGIVILVGTVGAFVPMLIEAQIAFALNSEQASGWSDTQSASTALAAPDETNWNITQPVAGTFNANTLGDPSLTQCNGVKVQFSIDSPAAWQDGQDMGFTSNETLGDAEVYMRARTAWAQDGVRRSEWSDMQEMYV